MLTLAAGMPRAGSGWHYNLVHDLVVAGGGQDARQIRRRYWLAPFLTEVNCNIRTLSPQRLLPVMLPSLLGNDFAVKTHSGPSRLALRFLASGRMRTAYIYRDPRAALLSALEYGERARAAGRVNAFSRLVTFEDGLAFMQGYLKIWEAWLALPSVHHMRYEDFLGNYAEQAQSLARSLSLDPTDAAVNEVLEEHRPEKAAQAEKGGHFQHGQAERFRTALNAQQLETANAAFAAYLPRLGYAP